MHVYLHGLEARGIKGAAAIVLWASFVSTSAICLVVAGQTALLAVRHFGSLFGDLLLFASIATVVAGVTLAWTAREFAVRGKLEVRFGAS